MAWNHFFYFYLPLGLGFWLLVLTGIGLALVASLLLGPWPGKRSRLMNEVLRARAEDVLAIEVAPHSSDAYPSLVREPLTIEGREEIGRLCQAFQAARFCQPSHPRTLWSSILTLRKRTGAFDCVVSSTDQGVVIRFWTSADEGWMLGQFRSTDLGSVLMSIVKAGGKDR